MKKIIISALVLSVCALAIYYYVSTQYGDQQRAEAQDIKVFFDFAQEQLPKTALEISTIEKTVPVDTGQLRRLQAQLQTYKIVTAIGDRNIQALKDASPEELQFSDGQLWVDGAKFKETMGGKLASRILAGENAFAFVLFHSILDKTEQDKQATLDMLYILIGKKLNPNIQGGSVFWIKEKPSDTRSYDYVSLYSLPEIASLYSSKQALELIDNYIKESR